MQNTKNSKVDRFTQPIRWATVAPLGIIITLGIIYFVFFFDHHLKGFLEYMGSRLNGAQVNISRVQTKFFQGDFSLEKLEVTNKNQPMKNLFQIDQIHFRFLVPAVFKMKFIIEDMSVKGVHYGTERERSGILPESQAAASRYPSFFDRVSAGIYTKLKEDIENSPLQHLRQFTTGMNIDNEIRDLRGELSSLKKIDAFQEELDQKTQNWRESTQKLPTQTKLSGYSTELKKITEGPANRPDEIVNKIQSANTLYKEVKQQSDQVQSLIQTTQTEMDSFAAQIRSLDSIIQQDVQKIFKKLELPRLDFEDLSPAIVGQKVLEYLGPMAVWVDLARRYMPRATKSGNQTVVKQQRLQGTDVRFVAERALPTFLLTHAAIHSELSEDPTQGNVKGKAEGITTDPPIYGKPTVLEVSGDFPRSYIRGAQAKVVIDHTGSNFKESFLARVNSFPIENWDFVDADDLKLSVEKAYGRISLQVALMDNQLDINLLAKIDNVEYAIKSTSQKIETSLSRIVGSIRAFDMTARIKGSIENPEVHVSSSIGKSLAAGLKEEFKHQMAAINDNIRKNVLSQVDARKSKLTDSFKTTQSNVLEPMNAKLASLNKIQSSVQTEIQKLQKQQASGLKDKVKDKVKLPLKF